MIELTPETEGRPIAFSPGGIHPWCAQGRAQTGRLVGPDPADSTRAFVNFGENECAAVSLPRRDLFWFYPFETGRHHGSLLDPHFFSREVAADNYLVTRDRLAHTAEALAGKLYDDKGEFYAKQQIEDALWFWLRRSIDELFDAAEYGAVDDLRISRDPFDQALSVISDVDPLRLCNPDAEEQEVAHA
ncbi:MAG: hypothetical protein ACREDR_00120 [Blastocatellia bacterium]